MIQNYVKLDPIQHRYFDTDEREYTSVSKVLNSIEEQVNWEEIAGKVAGRGKFAEYPTKEAVLAFWKANANEAMAHGTHLHEAQERYAKQFTILPEDMKHEKGIKHIASMFTDFYRSEDEVAVYSEKYMVAGTMDKCLFVNKNSKLISIRDFKTGLKTNKIDYYNKDNKFLLHPVSHLQNCKHARYSLQMSIYAVLAEECAGLITRDLSIIFIPVDPEIMPYEICVPYLRQDAINILEHYSNSRPVKAVLIKEDIAPDFIT